MTKIELAETITQKELLVNWKIQYISDTHGEKIGKISIDK